MYFVLFIFVLKMSVSHVISVLLSFPPFSWSVLVIFEVGNGFSGTELQLHLREICVRLMMAPQKPLTSQTRGYSVYCIGYVVYTPRIIEVPDFVHRPVF